MRDSEAERNAAHSISEDDLAEIEVLQQAIQARSSSIGDQNINHYAQRLKHITVRVRGYFED